MTKQKNNETKNVRIQMTINVSDNSEVKVDSNVETFCFPVNDVETETTAPVVEQGVIEQEDNDLEQKAIRAAFQVVNSEESTAKGFSEIARLVLSIGKIVAWFKKAKGTSVTLEDPNKLCFWDKLGQLVGILEIVLDEAKPKKMVKDSSITENGIVKMVKDSSITEAGPVKMVKDSSITENGIVKMVKDSSITDDGLQKSEAAPIWDYFILQMVKDSSITEEGMQKLLSVTSVSEKAGLILAASVKDCNGRNIAFLHLSKDVSIDSSEGCAQIFNKRGAALFEIEMNQAFEQQFKGSKGNASDPYENPGVLSFPLDKAA